MKIQKKIAIYGGTFNPVHNGHIALASDCQLAYDFNQMLIMPSAMPPHKAQPISAEHRVAMLALAFQKGVFQIDQREILREGVTYTIDTVRSLREEHSAQVSISFLMGADSFVNFDAWEGWREILDCVHLIVVNRPSAKHWQASLSPELKVFLNERWCDDSEILAQESSGRIFVHSMPPQAISSTSIRRKILEKKQLEIIWLPQAVLSYIEQHHLYSD